MKVIFTLLIGLLANVFLSAQPSVVISYSETVKMDINIENSETVGMDISEFLPESMTSTFDLTFSDKKSSYNQSSNENGNIELGDEDAGIKIVIMQDDVESEIYIDHSKKKMTEQKGFMGKAFIIEEDVEKLKWKITGEKIMYLDYECLKATRTNKDGKEVVAWFAPKIPVSIGPRHYGQLPGAILMVSEGDEEISIKATSIKFIEAKELKKPTGGKKVTNEEFNKIVEEKTKEMTEQHGGSFRFDH